MARVRIDNTWHIHITPVIEERVLDPISRGVANDANALAPVGATHNLAGSYETSGRGLTRRVGSPVSYAAVVELGSSPHPITVKHKKVLANKDSGEIFGRTVHHPGTQPQPHLRPALFRRRSL